MTDKIKKLSVREEILTRIANSDYKFEAPLSKSPQTNSKIKTKTTSQLSLCQQFISQALLNGFSILEESDAGFAKKFTNYLETNNLSKTIICDSLPRFAKSFGKINFETLASNKKQETVLDEIDVSLSHAVGSIIESGSIVVSSAINSDLLFLANCSIFVLEKSRIVRYYDDLITKQNLSSARYFGLISGPSKTGDIEQTILLGAHGPVKCLIVIV